MTVRSRTPPAAAVALLAASFASAALPAATPAPDAASACTFFDGNPVDHPRGQIHVGRDRLTLCHFGLDGNLTWASSLQPRGDAATAGADADADTGLLEVDADAGLVAAVVRLAASFVVVVVRLDDGSVVAERRLDLARCTRFPTSPWPPAFLRADWVLGLDEGDRVDARDPTTGQWREATVVVGVGGALGPPRTRIAVEYLDGGPSGRARAALSASDLVPPFTHVVDWRSNVVGGDFVGWSATGRGSWQLAPVDAVAEPSGDSGASEVSGSERHLQIQGRWYAASDRAHLCHCQRAAVPFSDQPRALRWRGGRLFVLLEHPLGFAPAVVALALPALRRTPSADGSTAWIAERQLEQAWRAELGSPGFGGMGLPSLPELAVTERLVVVPLTSARSGGRTAPAEWRFESLDQATGQPQWSVADRPVRAPPAKRRAAPDDSPRWYLQEDPRRPRDTALAAPLAAHDDTLFLWLESQQLVLAVPAATSNDTAASADPRHPLVDTTPFAWSVPRRTLPDLTYSPHR